jgi:hypothetical protein
MSITGHGGISSMRGKEAKVVLQSVADPAKPTSLLRTSTNGGSKDGGAFHAIINAGGGDNGCILNMAQSITSLTSTYGRGGLYSCSGTGKAAISFSQVSMDGTSASGSGFY